MRLFLCLLACCLLLANCQDEYSDGAALYAQHCANCHMEQGQGLGELMPPLAQSDYLQQQGVLIACGIRYGMEGPMRVNGKVYEGQMPANDLLSDVDILNILNYINNSWGNEAPYLSLDEVKKTLNECAQGQ